LIDYFCFDLLRSRMRSCLLLCFSILLLLSLAVCQHSVDDFSRLEQLSSDLSFIRPLAEKDYQREFAKFADFHGKHYSNPMEYFNRYNIFKTNFDRIVRHNEEAKNGKFTYTLAINQFADITNAEYRALVLGGHSRPIKSPHCRGSHVAKSGESVPTTVDWRNQGIVTPVKDQGQCGSCWAFSAVAAMEGAHAQKSGTLLSFSEQELVDCVNGGADNCTAGGEMHDGMLWGSTHGMELESVYPYTATSGNPCEWKKSLVVAKFNGYINITSGDETSLMDASAKYVISVGIDASSMDFQFYSSGVYVDTQCKNGWNNLDHGVTVVGYGKDATSGLNYWLVKNSWGAFWGESGYIQMAKDNNNMCGIATDATYPIPL